MQLPEEVNELIEDQRGLVSRAQLNAAGVPAGFVRWHTGRSWRSILPGVLLTHTGPPTSEQRLFGALLYAGPDAWLSGSSALACHGLELSDSLMPVRVFVPHPQRSRRVAWVSIRATRLTSERVLERGALRLSCRARAVVDAAADASDDRTARAIIVQAVQEGFVRLDDVQHWLGARRRNGTLRLKQGVAEAASGAWSLPESELAQILSTSPILRHLWTNPALVDGDGKRLTTPDVWFDDVALAVMVHSRRFHSSVLDWDATVMKDQDLRDALVEVVAVTPHAIATAPESVVSSVVAAYDRAARRQRPDIVAIPRQPIRWSA